VVHAALALDRRHSTYSIVALKALYGIPLAQGSVALTAFLVASALGVLAGGQIADKTTRHATVAVVGFVCCALATVAIARSTRAPTSSADCSRSPAFARA